MANVATKKKTGKEGNIRWRLKANKEKVYFVRVKGFDYKEFEGTQKGKREAEEYHASCKRKSLSQNGNGYHKSDLTFEDLAESAKTGILRRINEKDKTTYEFRIKELVARYGKRKLDTFSKADIEDLQTWKTDDGKSPKTVNDYCQILARIFDFAVDSRSLDSNPVRPYKSLSTGDPLAKRKPLSREQWEALNDFMRDDWFKDIVTALLHTGCRMMELVNLDWANVKKDHLEIICSENWSPKTKSGNRWVPISEEMKAILDRNRKRKTLFPFPGANEEKRIPKTSLQNRWYQTLKSLKKAKGVEIKSRIHDLRHTSLTWMAQSGIPLTHLKKISGHSSIAQLERYAVSSDKEAIEAIKSQKIF